MTFHGLLGLGSYLLALFLGWIGWRLLFSKPMHHLGLKSCYAAAAIVSTCILLSLVDAVYPDAREFLGNHLYPGLWNQKQRYHLGGAIFYYIYRDLPYYNLEHILNTLGSLLLFSGTLVASLVSFSKSNYQPMFPTSENFSNGTIRNLSLNRLKNHFPSKKNLKSQKKVTLCVSSS